jgi:hypothetical protein
MTAGLLMWLSTTTKNVKKADLEGVMALLEVRISRPSHPSVFPPYLEGIKAPRCDFIMRGWGWWCGVYTLQTRNSNTVMYTAAALWCLVRTCNSFPVATPPQS